MTITKESDAVTMTMDPDEFRSLMFLAGFAMGTAMKDNDREAGEALHPFAKALYEAAREVQTA